MPKVPLRRPEPKPDADGEQPGVEETFENDTTEREKKDKEGVEPDLPSPTCTKDFKCLLEGKLAGLDEKLDKLSQQVTECLTLLVVKAPQSQQHRWSVSDVGPAMSCAHDVLPVVSARILPSIGSRPSGQSEAILNSTTPTNSHRRASRASGLEGMTLSHTSLPSHHSNRRASIGQSETILNHTSPTNSHYSNRRASVSRVSFDSSFQVRYESRMSRVSIDSIATIASWITQRRRRQGRFSQNVWNFLDNPDAGAAASVYNRAMPAFILLTVLYSLIQATEQSLALGSLEAAEYMDIAIETAFALEIGTRFLVCPNRLMFFVSTYNLIDVASAIPLGVRVGLQLADAPRRSHGARLVLDGFVPVLRLLKTLRRFQTLHLLTKAFHLASEAVPVLLYFYLCVWLLFSAIVYAVEERANLASFSDAMWLTFISMTTVGYGDYSPKSPLGRAVVAVLVLSCTLYMAIPIGIIGSCFSEVWGDRDRILLVQRLRSCFVQNGFTAEDIPEVFAEFDVDKTGSLNLIKFRRMADMLRLGLSEARVLALFQLFDCDGSGGIDDRSFVRTLFPGAFEIIFNTEHKRSRAGSRMSARSARLINHLIAV